MEGAPRQGLGSFFRALMDFVDQRGLRQQVRAGVSDTTRATIDDPPRVLSFIPSTPIDDIESVLQKLVGDDGLAECGIACARPLGWTMLQPIIRMAFMVFGQSPEPIFANLDRFFSIGYAQRGRAGKTTVREPDQEYRAPLQALRLVHAGEGELLVGLCAFDDVLRLQ